MVAQFAVYIHSYKVTLSSAHFPCEHSIRYSTMQEFQAVGAASGESQGAGRELRRGPRGHLPRDRREAEGSRHIRRATARGEGALQMYFYSWRAYDVMCPLPLTCVGPRDMQLAAGVFGGLLPAMDVHSPQHICVEQVRRTCVGCADVYAYAYCACHAVEMRRTS